MSTTLPTYDALYAFLKAHYKHAHFEGLNRDPKSGRFQSHSNDVAHSYMDFLSRHGHTSISRWHSASGKAVHFDSSLQILETR